MTFNKTQKKHSLKILHLALDEKFIDPAIEIFNSTDQPWINHLYIFTNNKNITLVKSPANKAVEYNLDKIEDSILPAENYNNYDIIVFHSLPKILYLQIESISKNTRLIWLGWGYDYYPEICLSKELMLDKTYQIYLKHIMKGATTNNKKRITTKSITKHEAIERLNIFSPVLPIEHKMLNSAKSWNKFPVYSRWNYGHIEQLIQLAFKNKSVNGDFILVGNSASFTSNHIESFELLSKLEINDRTIVSPLSYGNSDYAKQVIFYGEKFFGHNFQPILDFLPLDEYVNNIINCGYLIMNHKRQQALGNIVIMLYLGARVFLNKGNPLFKFFLDLDIHLNSTLELEENPELINTPLRKNQKVKNKAIVSEYWSKQNAINNTIQLVEKALL